VYIIGCLLCIVILFFIVVLGVHCSIYKSSYGISNVSYLNSPLPSFSFIPSSPNPRTVSTVSFFHLHTCTQYLSHVHPPPLFPCLPPPRSPPRQELFCPPVLCVHNLCAILLYDLQNSGFICTVIIIDV
jgi:hypothetical protein